MARAYPLSDTAAQRLIAELGVKVPRFGLPELAQETADIELGETFEVWMLGQDKITSGGETMQALAENIERFHHQIFVNGRPALFARSKRHPHWHVVAVHVSDLARDIDEAIIWIDQYGLEETDARLLSVPAHYVHAFWLTNAGEDRFYLVQFPPSSPFHDFEKGRLYDTSAFLSLLQALPFEEGRFA